MTRERTASKVVLLGKGDLAIAIGEWLRSTTAFDVAAIVPVVPEPPWCTSLADWSRGNGLFTIESGDYHDLPASLLEASGTNVALSIYYDRIFTSQFVARFRRVLNLHNAPLPKYRGVSPVNWALANGENRHGVTLHEVTAGVDAGPIVAQSLFAIDPDVDEVVDVYERCLKFGYALCVAALRDLETARAFPQDSAAASHYAKRDDSRLGVRGDFVRPGARRRLPAFKAD